MNQEEIGKFIAKQRKEKKLTQEQLAEKLKVSSKSISRWENGINMPDLSLIIPISEELGISIFELLTGKKSETEIEDVLKNTITYSNIKTSKLKTKIKIYILAIIILASLLIIVSTINKISRIQFINYTITTDMCLDANCNYEKLYRLNLPKDSYNFESFNISENGMIIGEKIYVNNYRRYNSLDVEMNSILRNDYMKIECDNHVYYYNKEYDYSLVDYKISKKFLFNSIYYEIHFGNYCQK